MRPATLASLGLGERLDNVVGTALLARAAAMQVLRSEGPSARMQHLAALSIGTIALLDVQVTARAAAGLALALSDVPKALPAIAAGIAAASGSQQGVPGPFFAEPGIFPAVPPDWAVFSLLQAAISDGSVPRFHPGEIATAIGRDEGQPIGRLGISAFRWLRLPAGSWSGAPTRLTRRSATQSTGRLCVRVSPRSSLNSCLPPWSS
jgi:hypothetical protein